MVSLVGTGGTKSKTKLIFYISPVLIFRISTISVTRVNMLYA